MGQRSGIRDPHWWAFGGAAIVVALLAWSSAATSPPVSATLGWRIGMGISSFAMVLGAGEIAFAHGRRFAYWALKKEAPQPYLRPKGLAFAKKLRSYYEAHRSDPEMPRTFFTQFYDEIAHYQQRFASSAVEVRDWLPRREYIDGWMNDMMVDVVICSIEVQAAQVREDIPA